MNDQPHFRETIRRLGAASFAAAVGLDAPLGALTTYRVGGTADVLVTIDSADALVELAEIVSDTGAETLVVGRGSNLLVADSGFHGVAVVLGEPFASIDVDGTRVVAGGAAKLPLVARTSVNEGLTGFEWAVGVPGSVGGAIRMNAGGHGSEVRDTLVSAEVVDLTRGSVSIRRAETLELSYRSSSLQPSDVVTSATFQLAAGDPEIGRSRIAEIVQWRRANQPGGQNAGSVFTNPGGDSAGRLIETAGLKGLRIGSAEISEKHANFIQADEGGSASDILDLMHEVRSRVLQTHGVDLHAETRLVGFGDSHGESQ